MRVYVLEGGKAHVMERASAHSRPAHRNDEHGPSRAVPPPFLIETVCGLALDRRPPIGTALPPDGMPVCPRCSG